MSMLVIDDGIGQFKMNIGGEEWVAAVTIDEYRGGESSVQAMRPYEPGDGAIIVDHRVAELSRWGDASFTISQLADDSKVETIEKLTEEISGYIKNSDSSGDEQTKKSLEFLLKQLRDYYFMYSTKNKRIEVHYRLQSHVKRGPGVPGFGPGPVLDTKTANLKIQVDAKIARLISPLDWAQASPFIDNALRSGRLLKISYE